MLGGYWERKLAIRSRYRKALPAKTGNHWEYLLHRLHSQSQRRHAHIPKSASGPTAKAAHLECAEGSSAARCRKLGKGGLWIWR